MGFIADNLDLLMFVATCACLLAGYPVAFTLAGSALAFGLLGIALGVFDVGFFRALPQRIFGTMTNEVLLAVPLFVFMGTMLERARIAEALLDNMARLLGAVRGGLGISVSIVGALLAASTGIVGATVVTMGLLALPPMLKRGYDPSFAAGSISAAGTLGQIIPPSIVLVLLGDVIAVAYQKAQLEQGIFAPDTVSVGELFAGALVPGLCLVALYIIYQLGYAYLRPAHVPKADRTTPINWRDLTQALLPPIVLIVAVLGSILGGVATPTEAAAVGAIGTILLASKKPNGLWALVALLVLSAIFDLRLARTDLSAGDLTAIALALIACGVLAYALFVGLRTSHKAGVLSPAMEGAMRTTSMVFTILIGAALFSLVFRGLGGDDRIHALLHDLPGGVVSAVLVVMLVMFLLGFFLDFIEITFVVVPLVAPILLAMGLDPVWLGVMMAINLQTSFLTPPFGFALFYLRGVAPPEIRTSDIYRGAIPFVLIQLLMLGLLSLLPWLATWLPSVIFGG